MVVLFKSSLFIFPLFIVHVFGSVHCETDEEEKQNLSIEERTKLSEVVFHGLAVDTMPEVNGTRPTDKSFYYTSHFWLINVYKGSEALAKYLRLENVEENGVLNIRDRYPRIVFTVKGKARHEHTITFAVNFFNDMHIAYTGFTQCVFEKPPANTSPVCSFNRRVNVTGFFRPNISACWSPVTSQNYYVVFAKIHASELAANEDNVMGAIVDWSESNEQRVWRGVGWDQWSDWAACSASCGEGTQERWRFCLSQAGCKGYNKETRRCNMFACKGAVSPLSEKQRRYFHRTPEHWKPAPGRKTAWRLRPNAYLWLPTAELPFPVRQLRKHFALLVSLRLDPKMKAEGTLLSLRSRRQQNAYLSVELDGIDAIKLVHAGTNGTQSIVIPAPLGDGRWHQLALGIQDDSSVRSYLDCRWVSTDILKRNALDTPEDADLVIGYLFSGDLEQLVLVPDPSAVAQQCSTTRLPCFDPFVEKKNDPQPVKLTTNNKKRDENGALNFPIENKMEVIDKSVKRKTVYNEAPSVTHKKNSGLGKKEERVKESDLATGRHNEGQRKSLWMNEVTSEDVTWEDDEDEYEGSGTESTPTNYEVEWSVWSKCSVTCGTGTQTRSSRCTNSGGLLEMCLEAEVERKETRSCAGPPCPDFNKIHGNNNSCGCQNGGTCHAKRRTCHCLSGYEGKYCDVAVCPSGCLNGGVCRRPNECSCPPQYSGDMCQTPLCKPHCQSGGRCVGPNKCQCPPATLGTYCQNFTCTAGCVNGGVCVGPDLCECPNNATGPTCSEPLCDPPCENGATCAAGNTCICDQHTAGTRCQKKKCEYRPVQEPYTRGFRKLLKKRYETKCENSWKSCVLTIPEYQTVYKTFYRTVYKCFNQE